MKEQWKSEKDAATLEEGLQQEKQEHISKLKYNCCKQWIRYIRLIFLFELTLFFGWGCYMILQSYHSRVMENEVTDIIRERYPPVFESVSEVQKSRPTTELPVIFVKPEVIADKQNNFLAGIELTKEHNGKTIIIDVDSIMQTSTQNSISMLSNNMMEASDINNSPMTSPSEDYSVYDEGFEFLMPAKSSSIGYIDKIITTNKNEDSVNYKQLFEKLQNIAKSIAISDLESFENRYDFTENANRLTLNNQKDRALDIPNEMKSLGLVVVTSIEDAAQDDHGEKSSSRDGTDEQVNASLESDLVICPPYQSYESSDMSSEHSIKSSSTSQSASAPVFLERRKNTWSDDGTKNEDKHDADDSNMSMSASSDASASGSVKHFAFDTRVPFVQNIQDRHSSEITTNTKQEEEKYKLMNIEPSFNFGFLQPKIQDIAESTTPNVVKFQWFNAPPIFANNLLFGSKDISESSKTQTPSLADTIENTFTNALIPGKDKSHNECQIEVKMNICRIKCPEIMFDEEWNLASSDPYTADFSSFLNFKDNFDFHMDDYYDDYDKDESEQSKDELISNENSDKNVASLQHGVPKVIDAVEFQESIPSVRSLKDAFDFMFKINSFDRTEVDKHDAINSPDKEKIKQEISSSFTTISSFTRESDSDTVDFNKEWNPLLEVSDTQQQKQLKVTEEQDFLNSENAETFLESNERVYPLEKRLISIFNDEMLNIIKQNYLSNSSSENYLDYICSVSPYICSPFPISWRQQYVDSKTFLKYIRNHDNPYDIENDYNYRKKRMADDATEQYEQVSNTLEEANKNVNVLKDLKKIFQKMEILAACIDRLHERHLLNNKLDDDYVSNEFSMETKNIENHT